MNSRSFAATCALHSEAGGSGRTRRGPNGAGVPRPIGPMGLLPSVCAAIQVPLDHSMALDLGWQKKDPNYIYLLGLPVGKAGFADLQSLHTPHEARRRVSSDTKPLHLPDRTAEPTTAGASLAAKF